MRDDYITLKELSLSTLVIGAPGSGKTVLLSHFVKAACDQEIPFIFIDAKGDFELARDLKKLADNTGRRFKLFALDYHKLNPGQSQHAANSHLLEHVCGYSPFNQNHSHTELLNRVTKIFANVDTDANAGAAYYAGAYQNVLNSILRTLKRMGEPIDFTILSKILNNLAAFADMCQDQQDRAILQAACTKARLKDTDGLRNMINLIAGASYGELFDIDRFGNKMINIEESVAAGDIVLFLLNVASYEEDTRRIAQMLIADINATFGDKVAERKAFLICDEFGAYASQALADSVERGRSAGLMTILASQGLTSASYKNPQLVNSLMTSCGNFIFLQMRHKEDIETAAGIMGTGKTTAITSQIDYDNGGTGKGSIRRVDEYLVNPQKIRELNPLQAWVYRTSPRQKPYKLQIELLNELRR